jgi:phosphate transport system substrate-binding protein
MSKVLIMSALTLSLSAAGCGGNGATLAGSLEGTVRVDGSSTVYPITEAVVEEFLAVHPGVRVTAGVSGTGGGFKKFLAGEIDINDASRSIKESEVEKARDAGVEYIELPVAFDGLSVVIHPGNTWVDFLSPAELKAIWEPASEVTNWSDVRPGWPERPIKLYGPGTDSGTFDYFTEAINGKSRACRADFTASEDDNVLVLGVAGDRDALGFFGFAYYLENQDKIKAVPIQTATGNVAPSFDSINDGSYTPLSRPLFIYVSSAAARRPEVEAFVDFYLQQVAKLSGEVGYVPLPEQEYELVRARFASRVPGSAFAGRNTVGMRIEDLLKPAN